MTSESLIMLCICVLLLVYLGFALLRAEKF